MSKSTEKKQEVTAQSITEQLKVAEDKNKKALLAEDKRLYTRFKKQIDKAYAKMENCYLETAFALHAIYKKQLYKIDSYQNIYDFAKENYNLSRGTCNGFINICEKFGLPNENGVIIALQDTYKDYTSSQLITMVSFPPVLLNQCNSSMSVRELKKLKKEFEASLTAEDEELDAIEAKADASSDVDDDSSDSMNKPEKLDIDKSCDNVFVAQARSVDELFSMESVIEETFNDVVNGNKKKNAKIEIRIVF